MYRSGNTPKNTNSKQWLVLIIAVVIVALLGLGFVVAEKTGTTDLVKKKQAEPTVIEGPTKSAADNTKGESPSSPNTDKPADEPRPADEKPQAVDPHTQLASPTGVFVSNHRPNIDGQPRPSSLQSTCTTTPGATCQIIFTKGSQTKELPAQNTDRNGSAYWSWDVKDIGLTEGTWHIQAKAVLGSQTKTTDDATNLEIES